MQQVLLCRGEILTPSPGWRQTACCLVTSSIAFFPCHGLSLCYSDGKDPNRADLELRAALSVFQVSGNCLHSLFRWCNQELCPVATEFKNSSYEAEESLMDSSLVYGSPPSTSRL